MDSNPQLELLSPERRLAVDALHHRQRQTTDRDGAAAGVAIETARRHIAVADRLDFFDRKLLAQRIEAANQPVQKIDDLFRRKAACRLSESGKICEHDAER